MIGWRSWLFSSRTGIRLAPLNVFNTQPAADAEERLLSCCGSKGWARALVANRPYASADDLIQAGEVLWFSLTEADWLEAFACHPRIGEKKAPTTQFLAMSESEQAAATLSLDKIAVAMTRGNRAYDEKFGFRYIVFASGRTGPELLAILEERLLRTREEELQEAARQQQQITSLRMTRWLKPKPA